MKTMSIPFAAAFVAVVLSAAGPAAARKDYAPPPYSFDVTQGILVYELPPERLRRMVPHPFRLFTFGGNAYLYVIGSRFHRSRSEATGERGRPYTELAIMTLVSYDGETG